MQRQPQVEMETMSDCKGEKDKITGKSSVTDPGALTGAIMLSVVLKISRSTSSSTSVPLQAPGNVTMETPMRYPETSVWSAITSLRWDSTMAH